MGYITSSVNIYSVASFSFLISPCYQLPLFATLLPSVIIPKVTRPIAHLSSIENASGVLSTPQPYVFKAEEGQVAVCKNSSGHAEADSAKSVEDTVSFGQRARLRESYLPNRLNSCNHMEMWGGQLSKLSLWYIFKLGIYHNIPQMFSLPKDLLGIP